MTKLAKARRQNDKLLQKLSTLESRLDELKADETPQSDSVVEIVELEREILITRQAAIDIYPKLLPTASSPKKAKNEPSDGVAGTLRACP